MNELKNVSTPDGAHFKLFVIDYDEAESSTENIPYVNVIRRIFYVMIGTRRKIAYLTSNFVYCKSSMNYWCSKLLYRSHTLTQKKMPKLTRRLIKI